MVLIHKTEEDLIKVITSFLSLFGNSWRDVAIDRTMAETLDVGQPPLPPGWTITHSPITAIFSPFRVVLLGGSWINKWSMKEDERTAEEEREYYPSTSLNGSPSIHVQNRLCHHLYGGQSEFNWPLYFIHLPKGILLGELLRICNSIKTLVLSSSFNPSVSEKRKVNNINYIISTSPSHI